MSVHVPVTPVTFVGIDVVDLNDPRTRGKAADARFVSRVLDEVEAGAVRAAAQPDVELWSHWASKEAAFKTATKLRGKPPVFRHAAFGVRWGGPRREGEPRMGMVSYEELRIPVMVVADADVIQAVCYTHPRPAAVREEVRLGLEPLDAPGAPWSGPLVDLLVGFTEREADAISTRRSAAVRIGARMELADMLRIDVSRVEIVCDPGLPGRRPPRVLVDGSPARADVSLSHHGRWIAWAAHVDR